MSETDLAITLGVEEEFFLVDPETRDLVSDPDPDIFEACARRRGPHKVVHEVIRSQIETSTKVCGSVAEAHEALRETRRLVVQSAAQHGVAVMAASSHPFAEWRSQLITPRERYERLAVTFQESMRRMLVAGMHVHAGFGDPDARIRVMTALRRYLPLVHALSTSSPFHAGRETGFKSYRLSIMGAMPRTSMPGPLLSRADYDRIVAAYQRMSFIESGSELWWDVRPSHDYPTVEMRICDACPRLDDAVGIVALYASLVRRLLQLGSPRRAAARSAHGDHRRESLARPALRCARFSRQRLGRVADGWTSKTTPPDSSRIWRTTPASSAAKTSCGTCSPSSATAAAPTGSSTTSASAGWRAIRRRRRCARWSTW